MRNFDVTLLMISAMIAVTFVCAAVFGAGENETMNRIVEDAHHFLTHYFPAMLTGYGIGRAGEALVRKRIHDRDEKRNA